MSGCSCYSIDESEQNTTEHMSLKARILYYHNMFLNIIYCGIAFFTLYVCYRLLRNVYATTHSKKSKFLCPHTIPLVSFSEIAGLEGVKSDLQDVVDMFLDPQKFTDLGARMPRGILLYGNPGTGKTMLSKAIANEANITLIYANGPEFVEIYVGQGAKRIRDLFDTARKNKPCLIFIDEIDAVAAKRMQGPNSSNREHDQTLNQLLVELDNLENTTVVIGATNRRDILDNALLRSGRLDRQIPIPLPSLPTRRKIISHYLKRIKYKGDQMGDVERLAQLTVGFSGADIASIINDGVIITCKEGRNEVTIDHIIEARDNSLAGRESDRTISTKFRKKIAYHEAGHAVIAYALRPFIGPIYKVTIAPRAKTLGYVEQLPEEEQLLHTISELKARLSVLMGGRAAEEISFGDSEVSTGAASDILKATDLARRMTTRWGFSKKLGPMFVYSGKYKEISDRLLYEVELEVRKLLEEAYEDARNILKQNLHPMSLLAEVLLKEDTLLGERVEHLLSVNTSVIYGYSNKYFEDK